MSQWAGIALIAAGIGMAFGVPAAAITIGLFLLLIGVVTEAAHLVARDDDTEV